MAIGQSRYTGTLDQHPAIDYRGGALSDAVTVLARDIKDGNDVAGVRRTARVTCARCSSG